MRRLILVPAAAITAVFLSWGCYFLVDAMAREHLVASERFAVVGTVHLDTQGGGSVRVVGDSPDQISVDLRWTEGLRSASTSARLEGDRLVVRTDCPGVLNHFCSVGVTVHVPVGTTVTGEGNGSVSVVDVGGPVQLAVDRGAVRVEGAEGSVHVRTDSGGIAVVDSTGDLDLGSDNGGVRTEGARADRITATSDNGSVDLDLARSPSRVVASSDNGGVTVHLPADAPAYRTQLSSDNGGIENLIRTNPGAPHVIEASTDNGSISLRYRS